MSNESPPTNGTSKFAKVELTAEEWKMLQRVADKDGDGRLSDEEINHLISDFNNNKIESKNLGNILKKFDVDGDGNISGQEVAAIKHASSEWEAAQYARIMGYAGSMSRAFRYLAFTSDFGEALRPVASPRVVTGSYVVAFGYCIADVGWEAYKLHDSGYITPKGTEMTMAQCVVERATFQALASIAAPFAIIHTAVSATKKVVNKLGRFQKWGPSIVGLAIIPLLPAYCDHPIEHFLENAFAKYGPWATKDKKE